MSERLTTKLRQLLARPGCVMAPGAADAFVARLRERGAVRIFEEAVTRAVRLQGDSARGRLGHVPSPAPAAQ